MAPKPYVSPLAPGSTLRLVQASDRQGSWHTASEVQLQLSDRVKCYEYQLYIQRPIVDAVDGAAGTPSDAHERVPTRAPGRRHAPLRQRLHP
jgi:hypothetical protein